MAVLNVRNLPEQVHRGLRQRAARHGRSMEAEARAILAEACRADTENTLSEDLRSWVERLYRGQVPRSSAADLIAERRREAASD
jgi:plasmid stability protein